MVRERTRRVVGREARLDATPAAVRAVMPAVDRSDRAAASVAGNGARTRGSKQVMPETQPSIQHDTNDYVSVEDLDRAAVRVARSPLPTVFTLARDALRNGHRGTPAVWRAAALSRMRRRDATALAPLADARCGSWPDVLDHNDAEHETLDEALQRVVATPSDALLQALESDPEVSPGAWWNDMRRDPDRWQRSYADAMRRAWEGLEPLWRRSVTLLEREAERIDAAVDRGVPTTEIVAGVHTRAVLADGRLGLAPTAGPARRLQVAERAVILSPMIATGRGGILSTAGGCFVRTAYPLPDSWRAFDDQAPPAASLEGLLGRQRSRLLRRLDRPHAAGELSKAVELSPSATSYHLQVLETAGLISRERRGEKVIVGRTNRATVLLALYELP
jgi:DNA-binding transcriptional ArsR family regulator